MTICPSSTKDPQIRHAPDQSRAGRQIAVRAVNDPNGNKLGELFASAIRSGGGKGGLPEYVWEKKNVGVVGKVSYLGCRLAGTG